LLNKLLRGDPDEGSRQWFTPQDPDSREVARQFGTNIEGIASYFGGQHAEAIGRLAECEDNEAEALRWAGPVLVRAGRL
jgi:hypothetical protein